jgi:hypothetical protein
MQWLSSSPEIRVELASERERIAQATWSLYRCLELRLTFAFFAWLGVFGCLVLSGTTAAAAKTIVATEAGIVGDGNTLNRAAIQKAIDNCSAAGGGAIRFPAGQYVTGTIQLKDSVTLRLEKDAVLLGSTNAADAGQPGCHGGNRAGGFDLAGLQHRHQLQREARHSERRALYPGSPI